MTVYKISLHTAFTGIDRLNTPDTRKRPAKDIFKLLGLTPDNHQLDGKYNNIGEFFDQGGAIERVIKRKRRAHNQKCASCEPVYKPIGTVPEWHDLAESIPPTPEIPNYEFKLDRKNSTWTLEENSPSPLARKQFKLEPAPLGKRKSPVTPSKSGQADTELVDKMNDHMQKVYTDAKSAQESWSNDVRRSIKKSVEKLYDAVPWSDKKKSTEDFPRSQRCFAETILRSQNYPGYGLNVSSCTFSFFFSFFFSLGER